MEEQKEKVLERLEKLHNNLDTGMTRERYLEMKEQLGQPPIEEEIPPSWEDFPDIVNIAVKTFSMLGDKVYPDIGYTGKDYTNLSHYMDSYEIEDKEYFLSLLAWLDARAIKKASEEMKRQHDKLKRQSNSGKRNSTYPQSR